MLIIHHSIKFQSKNPEFPCKAIVSYHHWAEAANRVASWIWIEWKTGRDNFLTQMIGLFCSFFNRCLPILCLVLRFSKCGSVSSDGSLTRPSKHTLFLLSRCQSYFLVSSHNGPVKLCQPCFLCSSLFASWLNFMQICLFWECGFETETLPHQPQAKRVLSVLSMASLSLVPIGCLE